jgi:uncharacterized protein
MIPIPGVTGPESFRHLERNAIVFGRILRAMGLGAQPDRLILLAHAMDAVGLHSRSDVKAAARSVLVRNPEEARVFNAAFDLFWTAHVSPQNDADREPPSQDPTEGRPRAPRSDAPAAAASRTAAPLVRGQESDAEPAAQAALAEGDRAFTYSFAEGLYHKEFSQLSEAEAERARELTRRHAWELGTRRSRRNAPAAGRGLFDHRRTMRENMRRGGEVVSLAMRVRKRKRRDLVLLCDISGSMDRYSRLLLQFVHTVRHSIGRVEAFVFGTRLTRITRELRHRDIREALDDVSASVLDWAGGTRIGDCLREFNTRWAHRVLGRGAIVLIISDGWDRGDLEMLAREMRRLQRGAYRLIWLNPLLGSARYRPQTVGMQAALPYIDNFLPAHNLRSLLQLAELLHVVEDRRPVRAQAVGAGSPSAGARGE